jgi:hypothetical protein
MRQAAESAAKVAALMSVLLLAQACSGLGFPPSRPKAASTLHCAEEQISIENNTYSQIVTGCGKSDVLVYEGANRTWSSLRERLTFELSCPDADIDVKIISPTLYGVTGCGRKMVYKYISQRVGIIADTAQQTDAPAPKTAAGN